LKITGWRRRRRPSRPLLALCIAGLAWPAAAQNPDTGRLARIEHALDRAAAFMVHAQAADGAWRSDTYGTFRDGTALTPLALMSLAHLPGRVTGDAAAVSDGCAFLAGCAGREAYEYPVYTASIALLVSAVRAPGQPAAAGWPALLASHQFSAGLGWTPDDEVYGGWGYTVAPPRRASGMSARRHAANISSTVFALGALRASGAAVDDPRVAAARQFVERCQRFPGEGGFFFSPSEAANNKAGFDEAGRPRPYGSATADGFRALVLCGAGPEDARLRAAAGWLVVNFRPDTHAGRFEGDSAVWRDGYYFYYAWSAAHALHLARGMKLDGDLPWPAQLADELVQRQQADGAWRNRYTGGREDEALVATPFAASALLLCRKNLLLPAGLRGPVVHGGVPPGPK
jgi:hypothetical protein